MIIEKTGEMMNEEQYWSLVDNSLKMTQDQHQQGQFLVSEIKKLSPHEMIGYAIRTIHLLNETYTNEMWCAGYIMNKRGCSDDGFEDFRCWLISRGKETYYKAKADPEYLVKEFVEGREEYQFELFQNAAHEAFEETTGEILWDYIANVKPGEELSFTPIEFNWNPRNPESMKKIFPELYDKFRR